jgi:hypothetical protein
MLSGCNDGGWLRTSLQNCHAVQLDPCLLVYQPLRTNTTGYYVALTVRNEYVSSCCVTATLQWQPHFTSDQMVK